MESSATCALSDHGRAKPSATPGANEGRLMAALSNARHERFAQERALGKTGAAAWKIASGTQSVAYASAVGKRPDVARRVAELKAEQERLHRKAVADAVARFEVTTERVVGELARLAFANLADYVRFGPDGAPQTDLSRLTFDQSAALQILTIEEIKAKSKGGRDIRRMRFKLGDKRLALVALARHLGMFDAKTVRPPAQQLPLKDRILSKEEWIAKIASRAKT